MVKKYIAIILIFSILSLSANVVNPTNNLVSFNKTEKQAIVNKEIVKDFFISEGYSEKEINELISSMSDSEIEDIAVSLDTNKRGGEVTMVGVFATIGFIVVLIWIASLTKKDDKK